MNITGTPTITRTLEYSNDKTNWNTFTPGTTTVTLTNIGDKAYFRGLNTGLSESSSIYYQFIMTGSISASGSVMSLLDNSGDSYSLADKNYCFCTLFKDCTSLTSAPEFPATTLANYCYY